MTNIDRFAKVQKRHISLFELQYTKRETKIVPGMATLLCKCHVNCRLTEKCHYCHWGG